MAALSAGLVMYRRTPALEVLLAHPGGPFFAKKDAGAWSVPKGLVDPGEDLLAAARREFAEETSLATPQGEHAYLALGSVRLPSGKLVHVWAFEGDCDAGDVRSNTFELEWPPRSGKRRAFPEIDRAQWFGLDEALRRAHPAQAELLRRLAAALE